MSYPGYPPFVPGEYSNPSTPQGYPGWDVEHPDQAQVAAVQPQEPQAISPIVFQQHQQLSPIEPTTPQEQQQQQQQQQQQHPTFALPRTIELQERVNPSQFRFDNINESHFTDAQRRGSNKAPSRVGVDEMHSSTSPSSSGAGPSRVPHGRARTQTHPYRRPHSAASPVGTASGTQAAAVRSTVSRRTPARGDDVLNERVSQLRTGLGDVPTTHAVGSGKAVSCPAMSVWRASSIESHEQGQRVASGGHSAATNRYAASSVLSAVSGESSCPPTRPVFPSPSPAATSPTQTPAAQVSQLPVQDQLRAFLDAEKRFSIRTDVHFDVGSNQMTAMMELPGIKKGDIRIVLNVCPYSGVRQLTITGRSRPALPSGVYTVQERKFGSFVRSVPLPMHTKANDVIAIMEDGILILKVPGGIPAPREEPQDIPIH